MAAPTLNNSNREYKIDAATYPASNAVSDWYYAATADASVFVGVVDAVETPTQAVIDAEVALTRGKVYGGHWGVVPSGALQ